MHDVGNAPLPPTLHPLLCSFILLLSCVQGKPGNWAHQLVGDYFLRDTICQPIVEDIVLLIKSFLDVHSF